MRRLATLTLLACLTASGASAAAPPVETAPWAKPYAGRWTLSGVSEGDPVCAIALRADLAIGGAQAEVSATCRRNYPLEDVTAWYLDGRAIVLIDAVRKPVLRFTPEPDKTWSATIPGHDAVVLERGPPDKPATIRALFDEGTFTLSGPDNQAPCGFSVTARSSASGKIEQAGRCAAPWKGKGWSSWTAAGDTLQLKTAKGAVILSLTRADEYTFLAAGPAGPVFFGPGVIDGSEALEH